MRYHRQPSLSQADRGLFDSLHQHCVEEFRLFKCLRLVRQLLVREGGHENEVHRVELWMRCALRLRPTVKCFNTQRQHTLVKMIAGISMGVFTPKDVASTCGMCWCEIKDAYVHARLFGMKAP